MLGRHAHGRPAHLAGPDRRSVLDDPDHRANGRQPTFEERRHFQDDLETRISKYLREHEERRSNPLTLQAFRNLHQVAAGMDKGQVEVLLGPPLTTSDDAQQMANWARRHWQGIRGGPTRRGAIRTAGSDHCCWKNTLRGTA